jgi:hypothetical protein
MRPSPIQCDQPHASRKKKGSNDDWTHRHDPDAKITKMNDGRTHLAHNAEHAVDLETRAIVGVTVQDADDGDTKTRRCTLIADHLPEAVRVGPHRLNLLGRVNQRLDAGNLQRDFGQNGVGGECAANRGVGRKLLPLNSDWRRRGMEVLHIGRVPFPDGWSCFLVRGTSRFYVVFGRFCSRMVLDFDGASPPPTQRSGR